ncbi:PTS lactose/cellobiose transporter subunit IIA [Propionispora vibrioides]|uniref:PTS system, cellobiose-specific IIA component n=1 Tax=Propionispora vibrioides TaxID=112903 RepID=A0A1H8PQV0_9FIRM|nr:PTS lactose/cellobiose transporter subunit IIA [Propionispora vibrioides]SEO44097.1 PTS system, cellobiose-specific IIA component [Propionispora vibrioides]
MDIEEIVMSIIINSGEARAFAYEALRKVRSGDYQEAEINALLDKANDAIGQAHETQTALLHKEASGESILISILFVHAQDHLMTSISEKNLIIEMIEMTKMIHTLAGKLTKGGNDHD